jgi:hypothetical protein
VAILAFGLEMSLSPAFAQDASATKIPTPSPPFLKPAPTNATWVIHIEAPANGQPAAPGGKILKELDVTKVGDTQRVTSVWSDGTSTSDLWFYKGIALSHNPVLDYAFAGNALASDHGTSTPGALDFVDLAWVDAKNFVGKSIQSGHDCYYYRLKTESDLQEAWIDSGTGLPVASKDIMDSRTYEFKAGTETSLTLPQIFQEAYDRNAKQAAAMAGYQKHIPR